MDVFGPNLCREADCEAVLRSLPKWFGIEEALLMYARDSAGKPTFGVELAGSLQAFVTLHKHFPESWEVHCIAVHAQARRKGLGATLLSHAETWLRTQGCRYLQIKTIAETKDDPNYAQTRAFYLAQGYTPLEVFPTLWHPRNPALQLVKHLGAA